jgi:hypothetical protein
MQMWQCSYPPSPRSVMELLFLCTLVAIFVSECLSVAPPAAVYYNDLYRFNPATVTWTALSPSGPFPSPRHMMGFTATPDGKLYVFGGFYLAFTYNFQIYGGHEGWGRRMCLVCLLGGWVVSGWTSFVDWDDRPAGWHSSRLLLESNTFHS